MMLLIGDRPFEHGNDGDAFVREQPGTPPDARSSGELAASAGPPALALADQRTHCGDLNSSADLACACTTF